MNIEEGKKAYSFNLPDQDGKKHKLSDYKGKWLLLYFYPKDMTPGCTKEACALRDSWGDFKKLNAVVLGVSADSPEKHQKFIAKHNLNFPLLSDEKHATLKKYGVWREKNLFGRKYMGIVRESVLIDPMGKIAKVYLKVKPPIHAKQVLEDIKSLSK